ncbi:MAG: hypothetical protein AAB535_03860 [Patescibacteria group bacterium]
MVVRFYRYIVGFLVLVVFGIGVSIFQIPDSNFRIIACDVGQGDAILITYRNLQILTDGGPNNKVIDCLSRHTPFWDREIELVILTHPDADHSTGLIDVIKRYNVGALLENGVDSGTQVYKALEKEVGGRGINVIKSTIGMKLRLGMIYLDILHPSNDFIDSKTNNYSIVTLVKYKEFEALFTGDIEDSVSDLIARNWTKGTIEYIKVPHHGSKNGLSENLIKVSMPKLAVVSLGKNSYGHPHEKILQMLNDKKINIYRTDLEGDIEVVTDGKKYWVVDLSRSYREERGILTPVEF